MSVPSTDPDYASVVSSVQQSFGLYVNQNNYNDGAFKGKIDRTTPLLEVIDIFNGSGLVTEAEKIKGFRPMHKLLLDLEKNNVTCMDSFVVLAVSIDMMKYCEVFQKEMRRRGMFGAPLMIHVTDGRGGVKKLHEIHDDGTTSVTPGGQIGWYPSAPPRWNEERAEANMRADGPGGRQNTATSADPLWQGNRKERRENIKAAKKKGKKRAKEDIKSLRETSAVAGAVSAQLESAGELK